MMVPTLSKKMATLPRRTPGYLPTGSPESIFNFYQQFFVMEGKIKELVLVHECNRFENDKRPFSSSFTRIVNRDDSHGVVTPDCNVTITRGIPEFLYNILRNHFLFHTFISTET
jgi:hypothetical protein